MANPTFTKSILKVGTYQSPDGVVRVTPARLKHWEQEFRRLDRNQQVVPMHWDHGNDLESLQPVSQSAFQRRERSARNSVGRMSDFRVSRDGRSAEVRFQTLDPVANRKVASNSVYISPVIFPAWKDSHGQNYRDVITHLDLVNHPVDHSQGPARLVTTNRPPVVACALRMGLATKPYRMNLEDEGMSDDEERDDEELDIDVDVDTDADTADDDTAEFEPDMAAVPDPVPDDLPETPNAGDLMLALADHGIILPDDTSEINFLDRLRTALIAAKGAQSDPMDGMGMGPENGGDLVAADPQIATMGLASRVGKYAQDQYRQSLSNQLQSLLKTGRCTPAEFHAQSAALKAVRLSLAANGRPKPTDVTAWIASRKALPAGAVWSPKERLRRMSLRKAPGAPAKATIRRDDDQELRGKALDRAVDVFLKR